MTIGRPTKPGKLDKRYRPASSYVSSDPVKRQRSLDNLKGRRKAKAIETNTGPEVKKFKPSEYKNDSIGFIEAYFYVPEGRKLIKLLDWQKEILRELFHSKPRPNMAVLGEPKKCGKSSLAAAIALWYLMTKPFAEIYLLASSAGQSQLVCFDKLVKAIRMNSALRDIISITKDKIEYKDSFVQILAPNVSVAGLNPSLVVAEELWAWSSVEHKRCWDELTNTPLRQDENLNLVTSYAGFSEDEGSVLWDLYQKGIKQQQGEEEKDERFWFRWYGKELYEHVPWVYDGYLKQQEKRLRPNTFKRLHCNEWASGVEVFIAPQVIDYCITDPEHRPGARWVGGVVLGIDLGYKHDCSAIAAIGRIDERRYILLNHRLFVPPEGAELDIKGTVERQILTFAKMYELVAVYFDPYQMARSAQGLSDKYLPMVEFPQTGSNCVKMTETLQGLLKERCLQLYADAEVRQHLLAANVRETIRGYRLVKRRQSQKIDLTTAIALAAQGAVDRLDSSYYGGSEERDKTGPRQEFAVDDYSYI